jgi:hypothetical protein
VKALCGLANPSEQTRHAAKPEPAHGRTSPGSFVPALASAP